MEDISMILNTGDVPNLYASDEKAEIIERMQNIARNEVSMTSCCSSTPCKHWSFFTLLLRECRTLHAMRSVWRLAAALPLVNNDHFSHYCCCCHHGYCHCCWYCCCCLHVCGCCCCRLLLFVVVVVDNVFFCFFLLMFLLFVTIIIVFIVDLVVFVLVLLLLLLLLLFLLVEMYWWNWCSHEDAAGLFTQLWW